MYAMAGKQFGSFLMMWPLTDVYRGEPSRDMTRIGDVLDGLYYAPFSQGILNAPKSFVKAKGSEEAESFKQEAILAASAQRVILGEMGWTLERGKVQPYDRRAAGKPGMWNYLQPKQTKKRNQVFYPMIQRGSPDITLMEKWLDIRAGADGQPLLDLFEPPIERPNLWWEFKFKAYDEEALPRHSFGPYQGWAGHLPEWKKEFHGAKMESLYAILSNIHNAEGGLKASGSREEGQQYNNKKGKDDAIGVYVHYEGEERKCNNYATLAPVFWNGTYVRVVFEVMGDRHYRVTYKHDDQKIQMPNSDPLCKEGLERARKAAEEAGGKALIPGGPSIYYKSMWIQIKGYQDIEDLEEFNYVWNTLLEARPKHLEEELREDGKQEDICVVGMPHEGAIYEKIQQIRKKADECEAKRKRRLSLIHISEPTRPY